MSEDSPYIIGKEIIHFATGQKGKIIYKMKGKPGSFPDQLLIYWYSGREGSEYAEKIRASGLLPCWIDEPKIKYLENGK